MEFLYTIDPNADVPVMLIEGDIGYYEDGTEGVMGGKFSKELMFLDTLNKSKIDVWINSGGGSVMDSDLIISAILKSKTKVDTHNVGTCASSAGAIFLAGRNRYMMDYAKFMIHGISGASNNGMAKVFTDGIVTNLTTRCKLDEATARQFMTTETWLNATQCENYGIAVVEYSNEYNRPRKTIENTAESWKEFKSVVNKLIETKKTVKMTNKVTNRLKLVDGANEDAQVAAIEQIENRAHTAEAKLASIEVENKAKIEALNKQVETLTAAKVEAETKLAAFEAEKKEAEKIAVKNQKKELAVAGQKVGKIANNAEALDKFLNDVDALSVEQVKNVLEAIPASVKSPDFTPGTGGVKQYSAMDINNQMNQKLQERYKNN